MMAPWDLDKQEASMACERGRWIWVAGMTWLALAGCSFPGYGFPVEGNAGQSGEGGSGERRGRIQEAMVDRAGLPEERAARGEERRQEARARQGERGADKRAVQAGVKREVRAGVKPGAREVPEPRAV
ncbi:MAG TPA: hypothetical protein PKW66_16575, partial [Polyangiaceae bacterium]|nr:hypothetical protein [Polyangiaceae bacterium]